MFDRWAILHANNNNELFKDTGGRAKDSIWGLPYSTDHAPNIFCHINDEPDFNHL